MAVVSMSAKEFSRLNVLMDLEARRMTVRDACALLQLKRRQVFRRLPSVHQPRNRRERMGELIQIDGFKHWWFETRGPQCTLLAYIDDATSRLMHAAFVPSGSTFDYLRETHRYVSAHGRPVAFYSDKHAIFRVSNTAAEGGDGMTQFGRAMHELNIDVLCANTPAAKGRIERSFGTLQDRLVKEMRAGRDLDQ